MFQLDLPFAIQGICKMDASLKLIIGDSEPFSEVEFNGYGCYIRETGNKKPKKDIQTGCDSYNYKVVKEYAFVYFDMVNKYTLDSVESTVFSQLNQRLINVTDIKRDFATIKKEEQLKIKNGNLLKITFENTEDFINDCEGLIGTCCQ